MKKLLSLFIFLSSLISFAQQPGRVVVDWTDNSAMNFGDFKVTVPQFNPNNFNFDIDSKAVFF
jgi:hypothetical protein